MPPLDPSSNRGLNINADYTRDEIDDFLEDHSFGKDAIKHYEKVKRVSSLLGKVAFAGGFLTAFSLIALILIPLYSFIAEVILRYLELPDMIGKYIGGSPAIQTSTLIIVTIIGSIGAVLGYLSSKLSSKFEYHGNETGISSSELKRYKIVQSYKEFEKENYKEGEGYLEEYDGFYDYFAEDYITAMQKNGTIDEKYIDDTYEDFFGLFIERITTPIGTLDPLKEITKRGASDYRDENMTESEAIEHADSYLRIALNAISGAFSDFTSRISATIVTRPIVPYSIFLVVGVYLININATLAVVVVSVLTAGFGSWRRSKTPSKPDQDTPQNQNEKIE